MRLNTRAWLALALAVLLAVPVLAGAAVYNLLPFLSPADSRERLIIDTDRSHGRWHDPQWQAQLRERLQAVQLQAVLLDGRGREILRTEPETGGGLPVGTNERPLSYWSHRVLVDGDVWTAHYYGPPLDDGDTGPAIPDYLFNQLPLLTAVAALILTLAGVSWFIGRAMLGPLAAMGAAAQRIAAGELEFRLPDTRVREVAEVAGAFTAMGDALRASLHRQAALEQQRRLFISAIAHDLRSPLFTLRGYLDGLEQGLATGPAKSAAYIAVCRDKAEQLSGLVADLFDFSRLEYLDQAPHREETDLAELLRRLAGAVLPHAEAKGITLQLPVEEGGCPAVVDTHLLTRAVENLLDNALRHTPPGGRIEVRWQRQRDHVNLTVSDTGPGIDPADLPHLFEPLYRGEGSRNRRTGGAGLGLAIARRILRAHGGDLGARNKANGGAEFTATLTA